MNVPAPYSASSGTTKTPGGVDWGTSSSLTGGGSPDSPLDLGYVGGDGGQEFFLWFDCSKRVFV